MSETAAGVGSRLDALSTLASEPSSERRRELLREVTDLFFAPQPASPEVLGLFDDALAKLTDTLEVQLKAELAGRMAPAAGAPRRLLGRLVRDTDDAVAEPILAGAARLSEADLLGAVAVGGQTRLRAVSQRGDLTEAVSDRIVERGDDETVGVLVSNPAAPLSRATSEKVVDRARVNPALHEAVVGREALPVDLLNEMYFAVEGRLRQRILERNAELDPAALEAALQSSRMRLATQAGALPQDYPEAVAAVQAACGAGPVPASVLVGYVRGGEHTRFMVALARAAEVDFETVRRAASRRDFDAIALLCRAAGYDAALFRTLALLLHVEGGEPVVNVVQRFIDLDADTARRVLRFWKARRATALAA